MPEPPAWWARLPAWARAAALYPPALALVALAGALTPIGVGNAVFVVGALLMVASLFYIRTGGERTVVVERTITGRPLRKALLPREERDRELGRGVALFLFGLAFWGALGVAWLLRG